MYIVIEKGKTIGEPLIDFTSFAKASKWLVECADMFAAGSGRYFEIWYVRRYKTKPDDIRFEAEYEVLP